MPSVLIVDDLVAIHEMLEAVIQPTGFATTFATDGEKALVRYKAEKYDLVLADIDMKPMDGITLLRQLKHYDPSCVVIIMTAYASTESAIQALKYGAFDYLQKPFRVDDLLAALRRGMEFRKFQQERAADGHGTGVKTEEVEARLIGRSAARAKLVAQVRKLATVRTPVLLIGENGTGRTAVAEVLHGATGAPEAAFVRVDCARCTEADLREGLLGQSGEGGTWVQQATGGTLYLQNLECLPDSVQRELVSVLRNSASGFRLIGATSVDLERLVDEGKFHDDLFYRVASLPVNLPPLRARSDDIPLLVKHFSAQATNPQFDANLIEFTDEAVGVLTAHYWPGNLTELAQVVSQLVSTTETRVITSHQLPARLRDLKHWPSLGDYLAGQEKQYVDCVLQACRGNTAAAARVLGVDEAWLAADEQASAGTRSPAAGRALSPDERAALDKLKAELERQEASLQDAKQVVRDREAFLNESEARLFEKVQAQQEKENELEQREEDLQKRLRLALELEAKYDPVAAATLKSEVEASRRRDEFNE
ncbi:MAG: response regulator [Opitutaceae bacterium]|nr:response regulator [Opitutaceae bacterium]